MKTPLALTRNESPKPQGRRGSTCVNDVVRPLAELLPRMLGQDIEFAMLLSDGLPTVESEAVHIHQIILNLVLNARDAMPNGGKILIKTDYPDRAPFRAWWRPSFVVLSVADNGKGMDDKTRNGLGLSIVSDITKLLGGRVEVMGVPGQGTTINVHLPVRTRTANPGLPPIAPITQI